MNPNSPLYAMAMEKVNEMFTADYRLYTDPDLLVIEAVGILIARLTRWDGANILRICKYALEDANFHSETDLIDSLISSIEGE